MMHAGLLLFPDLAQLDLTGPAEVLARVPGLRVHLIWKRLEPVASEKGLAILPTATLDDHPPLDLVCVPGGGGVTALMEDAEVLAWLRRAAGEARYVTSVCTGALVLGAAGLLRGRRATTHWLSLPLLERFGAIPVAERVVRDGTVITGGGVTAGIDFALTIAAELTDAATAQAIQLMIEYAPQPPFAAGTPETAPPEVVDRLRRDTATRQADRAAVVERAAAAMLSPALK